MAIQALTCYLILTASALSQRRQHAQHHAPFLLHHIRSITTFFAAITIYPLCNHPTHTQHIPESATLEAKFAGLSKLSDAFDSHQYRTTATGASATTTASCRSF
jgi:hypothetical protein